MAALDPAAVYLTEAFLTLDQKRQLQIIPSMPDGVLLEVTEALCTASLSADVLGLLLPIFKALQERQLQHQLHFCSSDGCAPDDTYIGDFLLADIVCRWWLWMNDNCGKIGSE